MKSRSRTERPPHKPAAMPRSRRRRSTAGGKSSAGSAGQGQETQGMGTGERQAQASGGGVVSGKPILKNVVEGLPGRERRRGMEHARRKDGVSKRQACRVLKQWWHTTLSAGASHGLGCVDARHHRVGQRASTGATAAGGSPRCCKHGARRWEKTACNGFGETRG